MSKKMKLSVFTAITAASILLCAGCNKFLDLPLPTDRLAADGAYISDAAAAAVITGIIANASTNTLYSSSYSYDGINLRTSLYADDLFLINPGTSNLVYNTDLTFYTNNIAPTSQWTALYKQIYLCNLAIEGVIRNQNNLPHKNQWLGEAYFFRAFSYLDLVGLYGDVPLTTVSDYQQNNILSIAPKATVYKQIIEDLKNAETLLQTGYLDGNSALTTNRIRPNQFVAAALLARVYLYTGEWANAEAEATKVINNTSLYTLETPESAFLAASRETLLAFIPYTANSSSGTLTYVRDYDLFNAGVPETVPTAASLGVTYTCITPISNSLLNSFETNDARATNWLKKVTTTTNPVNGVFYFPAKYKSNVPGIEYNVIFRFAEQYLIRAEARAQLNNTLGAKADINTIRHRALLGDTPANVQKDLLTAVMKERRTELFTEWGHRFYDLKRTGVIDEIMTAATTEKSNNIYTNTQVSWSSFKQYWPIPPADIVANPNLLQTPGYQ